jgi:DMSO/TMAO reductase YedYZ molybdopterin-dependent catalytic subunit
VSISLEETQLAARNHGMPLEALRYDVTPVGLHFLLIHFDVPAVAPDAWRLRVDGRVRRELSLSLRELRERPVVRTEVTLECAGNGRARLEPHVVGQPWLAEAVGTGEWGGTPLRPLLEEAGLLDDAVEVLFVGSDRGIVDGIEQAYERSLTVADALSDDVMLAYELNGSPLPPPHGFPLRLVVPGWYGMASVKWLERVSVLDRSFDGYQQTHAYRIRLEEDEPGEPLTRIRPRALMIPPGIPDFLSRHRTVEAGPCLLEGRAWSGAGSVAGVDVSTDAGATWAPTAVDRPSGRWAWSRWSFEWQAEPGEYELACRATDETGVTQPLAADWNVGGYANNGVQRVPVTVRR